MRIVRLDPEFSEEAQRQIDRICDEFERAWTTESRLSIKDLLDSVSADHRPHLFRELLTLEIELRKSSEEELDAEFFQREFPMFADAIDFVFGGQTVALADAPDSALSIASEIEDAAPKQIGNFNIKGILGRGTFGVVYLAESSDGHRDVALKVARPGRFESASHADVFLNEARNAARIQAPGIVTILDVEQDDGNVCILQEFIEGSDLRAVMATAPCDPQVAAKRIAEIATAISHAHQQGVYHRDLKPANVLIDQSDRAFVTDFGLSLHESVRRGHKGEVAGTPKYMAPEQVRGESHRLDGRCDIWSLGVIFYQMLSGHPPFAGPNIDDLFDEVLHNDPRPPRQIDPKLPAELERICLKCLSKRMTDRYPTAHDLAADLQRWLEGDARTVPAQKLERMGTAKVIPKGLRSFEGEDADFFLELLPGPRDHNGLPDIVRFWKSRIEETNSEETFSVGLIYGPSGCGKSSLVKAGLVPRLADHVVPLYVESPPQDTELRLLKSLRRLFHEIPSEFSLPDALAWLRDRPVTSSNKKVLIVFDQFEQWLHTNRGYFASQLLDAIRQCDGQRIQCLILVRDDFWLAISRFMDELEIPLVQGKNATLVDRFDLRHAKKVLTLFGQAYGTLPPDAVDLSEDQLAFLEQSVESLGEDGRVVGVRVALFADTVKGKPWTTETLKSAGGAEGVGVTFLEETFHASTANPKHRVHAKAAQAVLEALLPAAGVDIKGQMKSYDELLVVSSYRTDIRHFDELLAILDSELHLITPTDPLSNPATDSQNLLENKHYQLTHDYLVRPLRNWLTRKRRESWRGRALLRLEELDSFWDGSARPQLLPSASEYVSMVLGIREEQRNSRQQELLRFAGRRHFLRWALTVGLIGGLAVGGNSFQEYRQDALEGRIAYLLTCRPDNLQQAIEELKPYRTASIPSLMKSLQSGIAQQSLHAAIALTVFGDPAEGYLANAILDRKLRSIDCKNIVFGLKQSEDSMQKINTNFTNTTLMSPVKLDSPSLRSILGIPN